MSTKHVVQQGECLATISSRYGFSRWQTIYEHPENASLRAVRPNPNVLFPGDVIAIPNRRGKIEVCRTGAHHGFRVRVASWRLKLLLKGTDNAPVANQKYEIRAEGMRPIPGTTGPDGSIDVPILATARKATLTIAENEIPLSIGALDPVTRVEGIQARLNNLGFSAGRVDGILGPRTRAAIRRFQQLHPPLKASGEIDDELRRALLYEHEHDHRIAPLETDVASDTICRDPDAGHLEDNAAPESTGEDDFLEDPRERTWSSDRNGGPWLFFDNTRLCWMNGDLTVVKSWPAVSGREGFQSYEYQNLEDKGPIPEGRWLVKQSEYQKMPGRAWIEALAAEVGRTGWPGGESSWGKHRVWLHPADPLTETYGRSGFSIHGGDSPGSAGCIDLTNEIEDFAADFLRQGTDLVLIVDYTPECRVGVE